MRSAIWLRTISEVPLYSNFSSKVDLFLELSASYHSDRIAAKPASPCGKGTTSSVCRAIWTP
jgi:hypothetical protein